MKYTLALTALAAFVVAAAPASKKHVHLVRSDPMADSTLHAAPTAVRLWFSGAVQVSVTTVHVTGADGAAVEMAAARMGAGANAPVIVDVKGPIRPGRNRVAWRTMSRDGHAENGTFSFTLADASAR